MHTDITTDIHKYIQSLGHGVSAFPPPPSLPPADSNTELSCLVTLAFARLCFATVWIMKQGDYRQRHFLLFLVSVVGWHVILVVAVGVVQWEAAGLAIPRMQQPQEEHLWLQEAIMTHVNMWV